ncbi:hypothetical protein [Streptomyces sp. NPDC000405]|uniref:hypothetical protein n=1 Tax=Streptomyces sp. NPDC000405 TaxID=3161033 RepID=UPI00398CE579
MTTNACSPSPGFTESCPPDDRQTFSYVADLGCGSGDQLIKAASSRPDVRGLGSDAADEAIEIAGKAVLKTGLAQISFSEIKDCIGDPDIPKCLWAIIPNLPAAKYTKIASKIPKISATIWGINKFLNRLAATKKRVKRIEETLEKASKNLPACGRPKRDMAKPRKPVKPKHISFSLARNEASGSADNGQKGEQNLVFAADANVPQAQLAAGLAVGSHRKEQASDAHSITRATGLAPALGIR